MAFTATDLASVEAAIVALATGAGVASVSIGDKMIKYNVADLSMLRDLRGLMQQELGTAYGRTYAKQGGRCGE